MCKELFILFSLWKKFLFLAILLVTYLCTINGSLFFDQDVSRRDMSNNTFDESEIPPWFSTLQSLTTLYVFYISQYMHALTQTHDLREQEFSELFIYDML